MKKVFLGILAAAVILSMCATAAFAAGPGSGRYFTDADGDGVCDNCGICRRSSMDGTVCGRNFTDEDGDGVCDNYVPGQGQSGYGCGSQGRHGNGFRGGRGK